MNLKAVNIDLGAEEIIGETESVCPVCLKRIPAERVKAGQVIYLRKSCGIGCLHVVSKGRIIPFCAYNLSNREGVSLYRESEA